ncbi:unnamed protein product [Musa textilis]
MQQWIHDVEEFEGKVTAIQQDYSHQKCPVTKRLGEAEEIISRVDTFAATSRVPLAPIMQLPVTASIHGTESYMKEILGHITSESIKIIGIYGMGGVGKMTLLKSINNHNHEDITKFDHVIWVVATRECRMEKLQMNITKRLELTTEKNDSEESLAGKLFDFLKNKNCLLFLNDLWAPLDLGKLGMAHEPGTSQRKSKVVEFTTMSKSVVE